MTSFMATIKYNKNLMTEFPAVLTRPVFCKMKFLLMIPVFWVLNCGPSSGLQVSSGQLTEYWNHYKLKHGKLYSQHEEESRFKIFSESAISVMRHNLEEELGMKSFRVSLNQFADLTQDEFKNKMGLRLIPKKSPSPKQLLGTSKSKGPATVDWRSKNILQPIQDQGSCGSCWTFSTVASIEAALALQKDLHVKLSEQNLVDCAKGGEYISDGCKGGQMIEGFDYVIKHGLSLEESYPYEAVQQKCRQSGILYNITSFHETYPGSESDLRSAVAKQPVSVAIDAGSPFFKLYSSGIYDDTLCYADSLNHGVVVVGYGKKYWTIRNSWGLRLG